ncbi:MAG: PSD1 domain-containing protein [Planctomycetaceae bacterium]|nr:PSD1 domain-containing protein [Planctomycetaceae bacterium]
MSLHVRCIVAGLWPAALLRLCSKPRRNPPPPRHSFLPLIITTSFCLCLTADAADTSHHQGKSSALSLLTDRCFLCHGPDEGTREADLRLDLADEATKDRGGKFAVKPGDPNASEILRRVTTSDPDLVMPPPDSKIPQLTEAEVAILRKWITDGADYFRHWAFVPPQRPAIPQVRHADRVHNPIDAFVLQRLEQEGVSPSPRADDITLLRRLSLDLIGLPPAIEELDEYLAETKTDPQTAYDRQVERLLNSPHYGERWGRIWLDAARYADSDGFEKDKPREVWFYRDWVIKSLNNDLPYDQFVTEQIAGDLLENATQDQIVATGFLRNSMLNEEGGIDPEEFRMQAMFDRMDALGKSVLGFTVQCAQCHSHKYDPFSRREYYQMFAFLNNSYEAQPTVYTTEQLATREQLFRQIDDIEDQLRRDYSDWPQQMAAWEAEVRDDQPQWQILKLENAGGGSQRYYEQGDGSLLAQGYAPTRFEAPFTAVTDLTEIRSFRLEMLNHPNLPAGGPGRGYDGQFALTEFKVVAESVADPSKKKTAKFVQATADFSNERQELGPPFVDDNGKSSGVTGPVDYAIDGDRSTAWGIDAGPGRRNQPRKAVFTANDNLAFPGGTKLTITLSQYQGGSNSDNNETLNVGRFRISAVGKEATADPLPTDVRRIVSQSAEQRSEDQTRAVFSYWRTTVPVWKKANDAIEALWKQHPEGTTQFTYQEIPQGRNTFLLDRGDFLKPTEQVHADVPDFLHSLPNGAQHTRLDFARWLVDRNSPTAARSIVNRIWQAYFGIGLVDTPEDLGSQGSLPSHPELLDWLAVELMDHHWSLKHIHRLIVQSNTYQQSSAQTRAATADGKPFEDPDNRLLSRGARFRVDAEIVRDIFLTASGLLTRKVGGPSVYPPAPEFLFQRPASYGPKHWGFDEGPDKYRRALYTFRFRSVPYPALQTFDAPSGEFSTVRRARSNTPLQALTTLNEPLFVECARALAQQAVAHSNDDAESLTFAFRCCVSREPTDAERTVLLKTLQQQRDRFTANTDAAASLAGNTDGNTNRIAAWTIISRILLNLDETITRE